MDNNFLVSVCNLYIFDEKGKLNLEFKTLTNAIFDIFNRKITVEDATFKIETFGFMNTDGEEKRTDFDNFLVRDTEVVFNVNRHGKFCKVIAESEVRNNKGEKVSKLFFVCPQCSLKSDDISLELAANGVSMSKIYIDISPYNEKGDFFKMVKQDLK